MYVKQLDMGKGNRKHVLVREDTVGDKGVMSLQLSAERMEILYDWAEAQIEIINDEELNHATGAFFSYILTPTNMGAQLRVYCPFTDGELDLSLIGDEQW